MGPQSVDQRLNIAKYLVSLYEDDPEELISRVVTKNEAWVHHFDPEVRRQSIQRYGMVHSRVHSQNFKRVSSARKLMACLFLDNLGVIMVDYLLRPSYDKLKRLSQEIVKKRTEKLTRGVLFLNDNARVHTFQVAMAAVTKCSFGSFPIPRIFQI